MFKSLANLITACILFCCVVIGAVVLMGRGVPRKDKPAIAGQKPQPLPEATPVERTEPTLTETITDTVTEHAKQAGKEIKTVIAKKIVGEEAVAGTEPAPKTADTTPAPEAAPVVETAPEPQKPAFTTYVVAKGDTLYGIARKQLGNGNRWKEIVALNENVDPNNLHVGQKLRIPATHVASANE